MAKSRAKSKAVFSQPVKTGYETPEDQEGSPNQEETSVSHNGPT